MRKFLAVVRHEYRKIVIKWTFLVGTLLLPILGAGFALVPALIFSLKGEPTRLVVVDNSDRIAPRLMQNVAPEKLKEKAQKAAAAQAGDINVSQEEKMRQGAGQLSAGFDLVPYNSAGKTPEQIRRDLNAMASADEIDAYLVIPADISSGEAQFEFLSRKAGDFVAIEALRDALNDAVRSQRLADANINEAMLNDISRDVTFVARSLNDQGEEKDSDMLFIASLIIGMMIYITLTIYGQVIMGAVVEEKETRIAEILFSSASPFTLMGGKLVGVALAGLTQLAIWVASIIAIIGYLSSRSDTAELFVSVPSITPIMVAYFFLFFLVGYFIYASIFALIGSMVTTAQEGSQFSFPPIMLMLIGFYFCFAVIRDPNSSMSFWVSISPFFAPLTMPVRILAETPPFWQIALALTLNSITIAGLVWLASRVYRVGMLMYGKRATLPEAFKWIRQG